MVKSYKFSHGAKMPQIGGFKLISPSEWLFRSHGDVIDAKRRALEFEQRHGSLDGAERSIEEFVRQWMLRQLIEVFNYPSEWLGERIIIEESVKMGSTEKEADISIRNSNGRTFLVSIQGSGRAASRMRASSLIPE
jgi:type I restriction enzyme M protein